MKRCSTKRAIKGNKNAMEAIIGYHWILLDAYALLPGYENVPLVSRAEPNRRNDSQTNSGNSERSARVIISRLVQ